MDTLLLYVYIFTVISKPTHKISLTVPFISEYVSWVSLVVSVPGNILVDE